MCVKEATQGSSPPPSSEAIVKEFLVGKEPGIQVLLSLARIIKLEKQSSVLSDAGTILGLLLVCPSLGPKGPTTGAPRWSGVCCLYRVDEFGWLMPDTSMIPPPPLSPGHAPVAIVTAGEGVFKEHAHPH